MADLFRVLTERLADRPALDVAADLDVVLDGEPIHVEGYTDLVVVSAPSFSLLRRLVRSHSDRRADVAALLDAADLTAELRVENRTVARLGSTVTPGLLERWLGMESTRLVPSGVLLAALFD